MTKRIIALVVALITVLSVAALSASAAVTEYRRVDDRAELLNDAEEALLINELNIASKKIDGDVVVVTCDDLSATDFPHQNTSRDYADMYYESKGYSKDGILILLTLSNEDGKREVYISTSGKCIKRLTDGEREAVFDRAFADHNPTSVGYYEFLYAIVLDLENVVPPHVAWYKLPLALLIGFVIAIIIMMILRGQLKSVKQQHGAANYIRPGSMAVTQSRDTYLYSTVSRTARPKDSGGGSSTHSSSGGGTHGGGGRTF